MLTSHALIPGTTRVRCHHEQSFPQLGKRYLVFTASSWSHSMTRLMTENGPRAHTSISNPQVARELARVAAVELLDVFARTLQQDVRIHMWK